MKQSVFRRKSSWLVAFGLAALICFAVALPARAATLSTNIIVLGSGDYNISVYPAKAAYTALVSSVSGVFGDGTVLDYRFVNCVSGAVNFAGYAVGPGDRVLAPTNANAFNYANYSYAKVWTTNDPGADFSNPADYTLNTEANATDFRGEVIIGGMSAGTLYVIGGERPNYTGPNPLKVSLVMSGPGQPDISVSAETVATAAYAFIWEFAFQDVSGYEKISYVCSMNSNSRGRLAGFILDGELIPKGTVLIVR